MVSKLKLSVILKSFILASIFIAVQGKMIAQVSITEEPAIKNLMANFEQSNREIPIIRGWKIQILTTNDRSEMEQGIRIFERLYPKFDYKWEHNPPYYQVRIGAYEKKEELEAFLLELKREFPSAIPIQDEILKTEILKY